MIEWIEIKKGCKLPEDLEDVLFGSLNHGRPYGMGKSTVATYHAGSGYNKFLVPDHNNGTWIEVEKIIDKNKRWRTEKEIYNDEFPYYWAKIPLLPGEKQ